MRQMWPSASARKAPFVREYIIKTVGDSGGPENFLVNMNTPPVKEGDVLLVMVAHNNPAKVESVGYRNESDFPSIDFYEIAYENYFDPFDYTNITFQAFARIPYTDNSMGIEPSSHQFNMPNSAFGSFGVAIIMSVANINQDLMNMDVIKNTYFAPYSGNPGDTISFPDPTEFYSNAGIRLDFIANYNSDIFNFDSSSFTNYSGSPDFTIEAPFNTGALNLYFDYSGYNYGTRTVYFAGPEEYGYGPTIAGSLVIPSINFNPSFVAHNDVIGQSSTVNSFSMSGHLTPEDMVVHFTASDNDITSDPVATSFPGDFTNIFSYNSPIGSFQCSYNFGMIADNPIYNLPTGTDTMSSIIFAMKNIDETNPIDSPMQVSYSAGSSNFLPPQITTNSDNAVVVCFLCTGQSDENLKDTIGAPEGFTFLGCTTGEKNPNMVTVAAYKVVENAGLVAPPDFKVYTDQPFDSGFMTATVAFKSKH